MSDDKPVTGERRAPTSGRVKRAPVALVLQAPPPEALAEGASIILAWLNRAPRGGKAKAAPLAKEEPQPTVDRKVADEQHGK